MSEHLTESDVVRFFDAMSIARTPLAELLRRTAQLTHRSVRVRCPDGRTHTSAPGTASRAMSDEPFTATVQSHGVFLSLGGSAGSIDDFLLQRLAVAVAIADFFASDMPPVEETESAALGQLIVQAPGSDAAARALRVLELDQEDTIQLAVCAGPSSGIDALVDALQRSGVRLCRYDRARTTILACVGIADPKTWNIPRGVQIGLSRRRTARDAALARKDAEGAFRFSQPSTRDHGPYRLEEGVIIGSDGMGGYTVLAESLSPSSISAVTDVQLLDRVLELGGNQMLQTLDTVVATGSIREAARIMHIHHNSISHRIQTAQSLLGFDISDIYGRNRIFLALTLRRIRETFGYF
ncbi:helix-turn-helix domain-containing protein [Streptomyces sp. NPDC102441]|uniref:helix-turn-helix domain-containing protein n=1 Tax=Streptomyces sp. NPDC102441 TaxID=3366176 RepID=UPI003800BD28